MTYGSERSMDHTRRADEKGTQWVGWTRAWWEWWQTSHHTKRPRRNRRHSTSWSGCKSDGSSQWLDHILKMGSNRMLKQVLFVFEMFQAWMPDDMWMDFPEYDSWRSLCASAIDKERWRARVRVLRQPTVTVDLSGHLKPEMTFKCNIGKLSFANPRVANMRRTLRCNGRLKKFLSVNYSVSAQHTTVRSASFTSHRTRRLYSPIKCNDADSCSLHCLRSCVVLLLSSWQMKISWGC